MRAFLGLIVMVTAPAAGWAGLAHVTVSEPAVMVISGAALLTLGTVLRRSA